MEDKEYSLETEISSRINEDKEVLAEIHVTTSSDILAEIQPYLFGESYRHTEITVSLNEYSDVLTEISVPIYNSDKIDAEMLVIHKRDSEVLTEIEVAPNNSLKAKYKLIAVGKIENDVEIVARPLGKSEKSTEIISRAIGKSEKETHLNVMYRGNGEILAEIQPIGYKFLEAVIEVPPHNRMYAIYEVQQPPIVTDIFNPTQDASTREHPSFESINYGFSSSMVVGRSKDEIWRSFVQFDLSSIEHNYVLKESYLRLYYKGAVPSGIKLEILNADSAWQEGNITDLNRPNPINLISNEFTVNTEKGYVEFDVLEIVKDWVALEKINNGFIIRISNETDFGQTIFYTRETALSPELVVRYFDSRIFSHGRSQLLAEIFAYKRKNADKNAQIAVESVYTFNRRDAEIYVHRREVPLYFEANVEIIVSKPYVPALIVSAHRGESERFAEVSIRRPLEDKIDSEITISKPLLLAEISSAKRDINIKDTVIAVTKPSINVEISIPKHGKDEVFAEIEINETWTSNIFTEIFVAKDALPAIVTTRVGKNSSPQALINVTRPKVEVEVYAKYRSDIWVEIEPNIKSDVTTEISVTVPSIKAVIAIHGYDKSEKDTEIYVKYTSGTITEINAKSVSQVDAIIDIKLVSQVYAEIVVLKKDYETVITVPTWVDYGLLASIEPRIAMVDNKLTVIRVGSKGGAYAFII